MPLENTPKIDLHFALSFALQLSNTVDALATMSEQGNLLAHILQDFQPVRRMLPIGSARFDCRWQEGAKTIAFSLQ